MFSIRIALFGFTSTLLLIGCGSSGGSSSTTTAQSQPSNATTSIYGSLNISVPTNTNVFAANIGESVTNTYTFTGISENSTLTAAASTNTYSINVSGLTQAMSIASNNCQNVQSGTSCAISIQFAPTASNHYAQSTLLTFTSNTPSINSQTLYVSAIPSTLDFTTAFYDTHKTSTQVKIGNSAYTQAEIDTGSQLVVADYNVTNSSDYAANIPSTYKACYNAIAQMAANNSLQTDENLTQKYGCASLAYNYGLRPVYGFPTNGSVTLKTTTNQEVQTNSNTPLFISNNVNNQNGSGSTNSIIFGVGMNTQVSAKNYLPYPYNVMMLIDRQNNKISFGNFSSQITSQYGMIQLDAMSQTSCSNHNFTNLQPTDTNLTCWNTQAVPLVFTQSDGGSSGSMPSLLDSGANNGSIQYATPPSWLNYNTSTGVTKINGAYLVTSKGNINIQLPLPLSVVNSSSSKVNAGNMVFQYNKVLYNQTNGTMGLLPY